MSSEASPQVPRFQAADLQTDVAADLPAALADTGRTGCIVKLMLAAAAASTIAGCAAGTSLAQSDLRGPPITEIRGPSGPSAFTANLQPDERVAFSRWFAADAAHDAETDRFWSKVERTREQRRAKMRTSAPITEADYVTGHPPEYRGPKLSAALEAKWDAYRNHDKPVGVPRRDMPGVEDFLASAKSNYGFVPERVPEREFKRRFAAEALRLGLSKTQVVRVYALETGGIGTADMQAGIHPITRKGRPISSALGYAQLLHANSVGTLVQHGTEFIDRLNRMEREPGLGAPRRASLRLKRIALQKMLSRARRVPNQWSSHVAFAKTPAGYGIHAINIDGDIGPWLQTTKLRGIVEFAARKGRTSLASEELELMNLAGPGTGIEMMTPLGRRMSNVNFFSRPGYSRNSIVRGRTAGELLAALGAKMDSHQGYAGAREFAAAFDELAGGGPRRAVSQR